jgi:hypothetical protein
MHIEGRLVFDVFIVFQGEVRLQRGATIQETGLQECVQASEVEVRAFKEPHEWKQSVRKRMLVSLRGGGGELGNLKP